MMHFMVMNFSMSDVFVAYSLDNSTSLSKILQKGQDRGTQAVKCKAKTIKYDEHSDKQKKKLFLDRLN